MKKVTVTIHRNGPESFSGLVAQESKNWLRVVHKDEPASATNPAMGEWFPRHSQHITCVIDGEKMPVDPFKEAITEAYNQLDKVILTTLYGRLGQPISASIGPSFY
jgi:hypothetical protein